MSYLTLPVSYCLLFVTLTTFVLLSFYYTYLDSYRESKNKNVADNNFENEKEETSIKNYKEKSRVMIFFKKIKIFFHMLKLDNNLINVGKDFVYLGNTLHYMTLAISLYASFVGNWILYIPPLVGATYSWLGIIGYAAGCAVAQLALIPVVSKIRHFMLKDEINEKQQISEDKKYKEDFSEKITVHQSVKLENSVLPETSNTVNKILGKNVQELGDFMEEIEGKNVEMKKNETKNSLNNNNDNVTVKNIRKGVFIFTGIDYVLHRYGTTAHILLGLNSLLLMWISLVGELTGIGYTMLLLTNNKINELVVVLSVSLFTLFYTSYGGLKISILTDKFQGILIGVLCLIVISFIGIKYKNDAQVWSEASTITNSSLITCVVLLLSVFPCEYFNQGTWQRILSARTTKDAKFALLISSVLVSATIMLLGIIGIFANALYLNYIQNNDALNKFELDKNTAFFSLMLPLNEFVLCLCVILTLSLVCSSIDTWQNAISALIASKILQVKLSLNWSRLFSLIMNILAVVVALLHYDLLKLYMVSNLLCSCMVLPYILSFFSYITPTSFIFGCIAGLFTIFACGWIHTKDFVEGLLFIYPDDVCTLPYLYTFILTPFVSITVSILINFLECRAKNYFERRRETPKIIINETMVNSEIFI